MYATSQFTFEKYTNLKGLLDSSHCGRLTAYLKQLVVENATIKDTQCPLSEAIYGAHLFEKLLVELKSKFESVTGKTLLPTYSYARLYKKGERLAPHIDREACEISATITLGFEGEPWAIYMSDAEGENTNKVDMDVGDAVLYQGMVKHHWREEFKGEWQAQVFLHYVDANGPHKDWVYDKRPNLNLALSTMEQVVYTDIFSLDDCDALVKLYSDDSFLKAASVAGHGVVNLEIRNVKGVALPTHTGLGGRLAAAGFAANQAQWKFDISHANQAEFLAYPTGGKYLQHVDTLLSHGDDCRKLTVLAFLNDDFKGGRFYIQNSHTRYYPAQSKGTVLVFPSFVMHGVEDVEEGTRYSAVCWMVGKFFK